MKKEDSNIKEDKVVKVVSDAHLIDLANFIYPTPPSEVHLIQTRLVDNMCLIEELYEIAFVIRIYDDRYYLCELTPEGVKARDVDEKEGEVSFKSVRHRIQKLKESDFELPPQFKIVFSSSSLTQIAIFLSRRCLDDNKIGKFEKLPNSEEQRDNKKDVIIRECQDVPSPEYYWYQIPT